MRILACILKKIRKKLKSEAGKTSIRRDGVYIDLKRHIWGREILGDNFPHVFLNNGVQCTVYGVRKP